MSETSPSSPRVPARLVVGSIVGLWLCYFILATLRGYIVGLELLDELAWRRLAVTVVSMAVTALMWPLLRMVEGRSLAHRITTALLLALPFALLLAAVNQRAFAPIEGKVISAIGKREGISIRQDEAGNVLVDVPNVASQANAPLPVGKPSSVVIARGDNVLNQWRQITDVALSRYFLLLAWAALYFALSYAEQARAAERREGAYRRAAKAAELRSLRYQVNPHFLFNTLNSLSAQVLTGRTEAAERMIQTLSSFYRQSLADDPTEDVRLAEEVRLQQSYLEIESVRFPDRLRTTYDVPAALSDACVPGMILQPLIENSVKYAVSPRSSPVTIAISAREEFGRLVLTVADNGPGVPADGTGGHGIGIANVRERLEARFGDQANVASGPTGEGYATVIRIPLVRNDC